MKRLIFLIWLLMPVIALANNSNVVIGDTAYFNYRHSSAIDSAQLILMRGAVNDTLSLMPIVGTSHKLCELETIFNQVDSAGTYQVWIEPYSSAAIIDTILGVCQVELAPLVASDNIGINFGDVSGLLSNSDVQVLSVDVQEVFASATAAGGLREVYDNDAVLYGMEANIEGYVIASDTNIVGETLAVMPPHWTTDDTAAYQGSGGVATVPDSLLEVVAKVRSLLMNPLPGSILPNGHLQVDWNADSTDIAGWSPPQGTEFYLTSRRAFEGYERSLYLENASLNTLKMKLDTGYYEMAAQIWFANATTDTAYFQCYNSANDPQTWLSSGTGVEYAVGWTGWHRFARLIRLTGDSTFYFTIGANAGDSAYFAEVSLMPYGAVGHTITVASGTGPRLCSLMVVDATPAAITDGTVSMTSGATVWSADISGDGFAVFGLTDATWSGLAYATAYAQDTIPQTFTVTASMRDTITMTAISIPAASAPNMVNAYIYTYDITGDTVVGARMEITPNGIPPFRDTDSNIVMIPRLVSSHSNTDGLVQQEIVRSSEATDLNGNNVTYNFKITKGNYFSALFENRTAPDSASWHIK